MEEMDNAAKLIRQNADNIENKCVDAINALYAEKRKARKLYQEEHTRILQQFTHVSFWVSFIYSCRKFREDFTGEKSK